MFIAHTLMTADVMVAVIRMRAVILVPAHNWRRNRARSTRSCVSEGQTADSDGEVTVIPDALFGLERSGIQKFFFLESDRATMPIVRSDPQQTSIARKFSVYLAGGGSRNIFGARLGISNFRVLTVTSSQERMTTMIDDIARHDRRRRITPVLVCRCRQLPRCKEHPLLSMGVWERRSPWLARLTSFESYRARLAGRQAQRRLRRVCGRLTAAAGAHAQCACRLQKSCQMMSHQKSWGGVAHREIAIVY